MNDIKSNMMSLENKLEEYLASDDFEKDITNLCQVIQKDEGREQARIFIRAISDGESTKFVFTTELGDVQYPLGSTEYPYWDISAFSNILDERIERDPSIYRAKVPDTVFNMQTIMLPESIDYERKYVTQGEYLQCVVWTRKLWPNK